MEADEYTVSYGLTISEVIVSLKLIRIYGRNVE